MNSLSCFAASISLCLQNCEFIIFVPAAQVSYSVIAPFATFGIPSSILMWILSILRISATYYCFSDVVISPHCLSLPYCTIFAMSDPSIITSPYLRSSHLHDNFKAVALAIFDFSNS